jgi:hypothetical protein
LFVDSNHPYNYAVLLGGGKMRPSRTSKEDGAVATEIARVPCKEIKLRKESSSVKPHKTFKRVRRAL